MTTHLAYQLTTRRLLKAIPSKSLIGQPSRRLRPFAHRFEGTDHWLSTGSLTDPVHPQSIRSFNSRVIENPTRLEEAKVSLNETYPRCPTCSAGIRTQFSETTEIEEKCKCPTCKSFIAVEDVILREEDLKPSGHHHSTRLIDYFKLFEIDKKFIDCDLARLKKSYHLWQQVVHPDFSSFINRSSDSPSLKFMEKWSVLVNRAKGILTDDLSRAEYLLKLHGSVELADEADSVTDMNLLMEIMEIREQLDHAKTADEVDSLKQSNQESTQDVLVKLDDKFKALINGHNQDENRSNSERIKELIIKLRYFKKIQEIISSKPD